MILPIFSIGFLTEISLLNAEVLKKLKYWDTMIYYTLRTIVCVYIYLPSSVCIVSQCLYLNVIQLTIIVNSYINCRVGGYWKLSFAIIAWKWLVIIAILQLLFYTVYDNKNRLIFLKGDTSDIVFLTVLWLFLIAVRQYFAIVIILADKNHAIQLLQWNNIAMYAIYWIIAQP